MKDIFWTMYATFFVTSIIEHIRRKQMISATLFSIILASSTCIVWTKKPILGLIASLIGMIAVATWICFKTYWQWKENND